MGKPDVSISVVGCGWLGLPLAKKALRKGFLVKGSTTSNTKLPELINAGIEPFLLRLPGDAEIDRALFKADYLVLNIPPGRRNPDLLLDYPASIARVVRFSLEMGQIRKIIFVSSTSVYGDNLDYINENTEPNPQSSAGEALVKAEQLVVHSGIDYNILRFGGLAGPGRHPGRFLAGRTGLPSGHQSINFLHLEDAVGVVMHFLTTDMKNLIFNVVSPKHPTKQEFYHKMTSDLGLEAPLFQASSGAYKREISVDTFLEKTGYRFIFPDPLKYKF